MGKPPNNPSKNEKSAKKQRNTIKIQLKKESVLKADNIVAGDYVDKRTQIPDDFINQLLEGLHEKFPALAEKALVSHHDSLQISKEISQRISEKCQDIGYPKVPRDRLP